MNYVCIDLTPWQEQLLIDAGASIIYHKHAGVVRCNNEQVNDVLQIIEQEDILCVATAKQACN